MRNQNGGIQPLQGHHRHLVNGYDYSINRRWRRWHCYYNWEKRKAIRLLNKRVPSRQIARMIGPHCSFANPIRWHRQARRQAERLRRWRMDHGPF